MKILRQIFCRHRFKLEDMEKTNFPEIEKPGKDARYAEWQKYHADAYEQDSVRKRISWPCCKCDKVFYGHCGLDILSKGEVIQ